MTSVETIKTQALRGADQALRQEAHDRLSREADLLVSALVPTVRRHMAAMEAAGSRPPECIAALTTAFAIVTGAHLVAAKANPADVARVADQLAALTNFSFGEIKAGRQ